MISLIIPSMNKLYYTRRCLASLLLTRGVDIEFVLVDNGSQDGTAEYLLEFRKTAAENGIPVTIIINDRNVGACTARNQAIAVAKGSEVAFLDNDIVLRDVNWLLKLRETLYSSDDIALVTPKLLFPFPPYAIEHCSIAISPTGTVGYIGRGKLNDDPRYNERKDIQGSASACVLVKKSVLDEVGNFDEIFNPVQFEDLDLFYRMKEKGYRLVYEPAAEMYHFENVTTDNSPTVNFKYQTIKNGVVFKKRWRHMFTIENGPADEELRWEELPRQRIEDIGDLPIIE